MRLHLTSNTLLALVLSLAATAVAQENAAPSPAAINVYPADVHLTTLRDRQSLIVQAAYADGITRDVTKDAKFTLSNDALASVEGNVLRPKADGTAELKVEDAGLVVNLPLTVQNAAADPPISF